MLRAADMISSRLPDRFLRFHSSKSTVAFLPEISILHTLNPVSDFSFEQHETNIHPLLQASQMEMVVIGTSRVW